MALSSYGGEMGGGGSDFTSLKINFVATYCMNVV